MCSTGHASASREDITAHCSEPTKQHHPRLAKVAGRDSNSNLRLSDGVVARCRAVLPPGVGAAVTGLQPSILSVVEHGARLTVYFWTKLLELRVLAEDHLPRRCKSEDHREFHEMLLRRTASERNYGSAVKNVGGTHLREQERALHQPFLTVIMIFFCLRIQCTAASFPGLYMCKLGISLKCESEWEWEWGCMCQSVLTLVALARARSWASCYCLSVLRYWRTQVILRSNVSAPS